MATETQLEFAGRVSAAARAAWWTWLVGVLIVLVQAAGYLVYVHVEGFRELIAGLMGVEADEFQEFILVFILTVRLFLVVGLMACIFLSLWAKGLRRAGGA
ncbi:MAG: hypothetical protein NT049_11405 [Planctomycetota bacterium]|nr:hypothetical protein [Planctomycetota bacterium]